MDNHEKFLEHLDASEEPVWLIARWLSGRGYSVQVPAASRANKREDWKDHVDSGDLYISQRVEVKQLSVNFTSRSDWPYRDDFIVCAKHAYDNATPKPYTYIIVSADSSHAAAVMCLDSGKWYTGIREDSRYKGVKQEFYFAPLDTVRFFPLEVSR